MLTGSQSPSQRTVQLYVFGYHALSRCAVAILVVTAFWLLSTFSKNQRFGFGEGDRVVIDSNSVAERLQHDGWLGSRIQAVHPDHRIVFRDASLRNHPLTSKDQLALWTDHVQSQKQDLIATSRVVPFSPVANNDHDEARALPA